MTETEVSEWEFPVLLFSIHAEGVEDKLNNLLNKCDENDLREVLQKYINFLEKILEKIKDSNRDSRAIKSLKKNKNNIQILKDYSNGKLDFESFIKKLKNEVALKNYGDNTNLVLFTLTCLNLAILFSKIAQGKKIEKKEIEKVLQCKIDNNLIIELENIVHKKLVTH